MKKYKTIAFDCFGTLAYISNPKHPFKQLLQKRVDTTDSPSPHSLMTQPFTLRRAAKEFGIQISSEELATLEDALEEELDSIRLYPETREVLGTLFHSGYRIAVCSNLAMDYATPVRYLLDDVVHALVWSFQVGAIKPSPDIYARVLERTGSSAEETLMVGDSLTADYQGARASGLDALHLVRNGTLEHPWQISSLREVLGVLETRNRLMGDP